MDITTLTAFRKQMDKERKFTEKWAKEAELREQLRPKNPDEPKLPEPRVLSRSSSAAHFLSQKMGLAENPHPDPSKVDRGQWGHFSTNDLLYFGVSSEGQGRAAYLKKRSRLPLKDKVMFPVQESQEVGWSIKQMHSGETSAFARRPIVHTSFFRQNGVPLKMHQNPIKK